MGAFGITGWQPDHFREGSLRANPTSAFEDAWKAFPALLAHIGYDGSPSWPVFYMPEGDKDLFALAVSEIQAAMPAWHAAQARKKEDNRRHWEAVFAEKARRNAEKARAEAERPARVRSELTALVETRIWLLQAADQELAVKLAAAGDRMNVATAEALVKRAAATLARTAERTSAPIEADAMLQAEDAGVRDAVRDACRWLSALDGDRAQESNGEGWGKVTSVSGHYLAEQAALTPAQAAYGLRILHRHRNQLPPVLRGRLGI